MTVATEDAVRAVVQEVLTQLGHRSNGSSPGTCRNGDWGVFQNVDDAVAAATAGYEKLREASMADRAKAIECVRRICTDQAEELGPDGNGRDQDRPARP